MNSHNKKAFKLGQAAAIGQVLIDQSVAAMKAWASAQSYPPPYGQIMGAVGVAMAAAQGAMAIGQIRSQQPPAFRTGGSMMVGGTGGTDSQLVQFYATPGERINVNTPSQANAAQDTTKMLREQLRANNQRPTEVHVHVPQTTDYRSASQIGQYVAEGVSGGSRNS